MNERADTFWSGEHLRVVVTDSLGGILFELRLSGHRQPSSEMLRIPIPELLN